MGNDSNSVFPVFMVEKSINFPEESHRLGDASGLMEKQNKTIKTAVNNESNKGTHR